jgi:hypothetical protein
MGSSLLAPIGRALPYERFRNGRLRIVAIMIHALQQMNSL